MKRESQRERFVRQLLPVVMDLVAIVERTAREQAPHLGALNPDMMLPAQRARLIVRELQRDTTTSCGV